jgi:hypothetical protein
VTHDRVANSVFRIVSRSSDELFVQLVDGAGHRLPNRRGDCIVAVSEGVRREVTEKCEDWFPVSYSFFLAHQGRPLPAIRTGRRPWGNNADYLLARECRLIVRFCAPAEGAGTMNRTASLQDRRMQPACSCVLVQVKPHRNRAACGGARGNASRSTPDDSSGIRPTSTRSCRGNRRLGASSRRSKQPATPSSW